MAEITNLPYSLICSWLFCKIAVTFLWSLKFYIALPHNIPYLHNIAVPLPLCTYFSILVVSAGLCWIIVTSLRVLSMIFLVWPVSSNETTSFYLRIFSKSILLCRFLNSCGAPLMFRNAHFRGPPPFVKLRTSMS